MNKQPFVKNAADVEQVREAEHREKREKIISIEDMRYVLGSEQGRRVMWKLLSHCNVFKSIWHPSAQIHHASGMQDVGHFIMAEIMDADEGALIQMMTESKGAKNVTRK